MAARAVLVSSLATATAFSLRLPVALPRRSPLAAVSLCADKPPPEESALKPWEVKPAWETAQAWEEKSEAEKKRDWEAQAQVKEEKTPPVDPAPPQTIESLIAADRKAAKPDGMEDEMIERFADMAADMVLESPKCPIRIRHQTPTSSVLLGRAEPRVSERWRPATEARESRSDAPTVSSLVFQIVSSRYRLALEYSRARRKCLDCYRTIGIQGAFRQRRTIDALR